MWVDFSFIIWKHHDSLYESKGNFNWDELNQGLVIPNTQTLVKGIAGTRNTGIRKVAFQNHKRASASYWQASSHWGCKLVSVSASGELQWISIRQLGASRVIADHTERDIKKERRVGGGWIDLYFFNNWKQFGITLPCTELIKFQIL